MSDPLHLTERPALPRNEQIFPTLTPDQLARLAPHGRRRPVARGEVLIEAGAANVPCFVVISGALDIVQRDGPAEYLVTTQGPGQFTGEANMISGRRALSFCGASS
jgi:thioredoxin reductase (NADPH)